MSWPNFGRNHCLTLLHQFLYFSTFMSCIFIPGSFSFTCTSYTHLNCKILNKVFYKYEKATSVTESLPHSIEQQNWESMLQEVKKEMVECVGMHSFKFQWSLFFASLHLSTCPLVVYTPVFHLWGNSGPPWYSTPLGNLTFDSPSSELFLK